jgi:nitrogen regulatory protein PII
MKRVEIIANRSVEEDLMDALAAVGLAGAYTKFPVVHGQGRQGTRDGGTVWPEENFVLVIYCEAAEAAVIEDLVATLKARFPNEGIKVFAIG